MCRNVGVLQRRFIAVLPKLLPLFYVSRPWRNPYGVSVLIVQMLTGRHGMVAQVRLPCGISGFNAMPLKSGAWPPRCRSSVPHTGHPTSP